jgi:Fic family protein
LEKFPYLCNDNNERMAIHMIEQTITEQLAALIREYKSLGIDQQIDYNKFYLYSIITHSTAIEGSTVTEVENQLLFDEGISAKGRSITEQLMNLDLKAAYEQSIKWAHEHKELSANMLCELSAIVMKNTGSLYHTLMGDFDSTKGDLRLVNVTAGAGGRSYMNYMKVPYKLEEFCKKMNEQRVTLMHSNNLAEKYMMSFDAHLQLVTIHPWVDGNGRMSRLIMNHLQFEMGLLPTKVSKENKAAYIEALIASREQENSEPFRLFMMNELIAQLQTEIALYQKDLESDVPQGVPQDVPQGNPARLSAIQTRILELISADNKSTRRQMAEQLHVSEKTIGREIKKMPMIRYEGSGYSGHWIISYPKNE